MEYNIISGHVEEFKQYFSGQRILLTDEEIQDYLRIRDLYKEKKKNVSDQIISCLLFIDILIDVSNTTIQSPRYKGYNICTSYGEYLHLKIITEKEIYDNFKIYQGITEEKYLLIYFNEILSLIDLTIQNHSVFIEKANNFLNENQSLKERYTKYVVPFFKIDELIKSYHSSNNLLSLIDKTINLYDERLIKFYHKLRNYVDGIEPVAIYYLINYKTLPEYFNDNPLIMKNNKKSDIIRFGDFFGLTPAQVSKMFNVRIFGQNRNKDTIVTGIYKDVFQFFKEYENKITN